MKRKRSDSLNNSNKKRKYLNNEWVAASKTRNAALNDHLLDYCKEYNVKDINDTPNKMKCTFEPSSKYERKHKESLDAISYVDLLLINGNNFEEFIIDKIKSKFGNLVKKVCEPIESRNFDNYNLTIDYIKEGVPIIYQAVIRCNKLKSFGCVDLLVRSDYINKLIDNVVITRKEQRIKAPLCNGNYHYRCIDIKNTKMHFNSNEITLRNNCNVKPYKVQLNIYNLGLGEMQGYLPNEGYILGNGWIKSKMVNGYKDSIIVNNPFNKLGVIDYSNFDNCYNSITLDAVSWLHYLNKSEHLEHNPPNDNRLYPNMCNKMDGYYHRVKKQISEKYDEITSVFQCGVDNRNCALKEGIKSWSDKKCNASILGIRGNKNISIVNKILDFNRDSCKNINIDKIGHNKDNWRDNKLNLFVDFETIQSMLNNSSNKTSMEIDGDYIFMIGIGWNNLSNRKWNYKCMFVNEITLDEEEKLLKKFNKEINDLEKKYKMKSTVYHWSHAEKKFYNNSILRYNHIFDKINWYDFYLFFKENNILIKGALNFSLKTIAKSMYNCNMISTVWDDNMSGLDAMFKSWKEYNLGDIKKSKIFKQVIRYNEVDCKTMFEILNYLKNNH